MNVIFYLKESKGVQKTVMIRINGSVFKNGRFVYSTGIQVPEKDWDGQTIKPKKEDAKRAILKRMESFIIDYRKTYLEDSYLTNLEAELNKAFNPNRLQAPLPSPTPDAPKTIIELWSDFLDSIKGTVEDSTYQNYRNSLETSPADQAKDNKKEKRKKVKRANFKNFLESKRWLDITPEKFTVTHFNNYLSYLKSNSKPNTTAKRLKHFKAIMLHIQDDLKIPLGFDINKVKYKETAGLKLSLTEDQLDAYIQVGDLPEHLIKVRDLAVIQCSTGLRLSDRGRIDKNIHGGKIKIEAKKTRGGIEIPITPRVRAILEKYNYELPQISEQNYRSGIKAIHKKLFPDQVVQLRDGSEFVTVPVHEEISSHDMVRTFITLSAERGMNIGAIAKITGKSIATLLKSYLVESQKVAEKEMEKAWGSSNLKVAR
jgi:hypothetical protein